MLSFVLRLCVLVLMCVYKSLDMYKNERGGGEDGERERNWDVPSSLILNSSCTAFRKYESTFVSLVLSKPNDFSQFLVYLYLYYLSPCFS